MLGKPEPRMSKTFHLLAAGTYTHTYFLYTHGSYTFSSYLKMISNLQKSSQNSVKTFCFLKHCSE